MKAALSVVAPTENGWKVRSGNGWATSLICCLRFNPQNLPNSYQRVFEVIKGNYLACDLLVDEPQLFVQRYVNSRLECDRELRPVAYESGVTLVDRFAQYIPEEQKVHMVTGWEVEKRRSAI